MTSPYARAPATSFWSRSVSRGFDAGRLLPGGRLLRADDRVMSAGSCFAANIVPYLQRSGIAYVRTERRPAMLRVPPEAFGYDGFSAAYGNIYTSRQLLQLLYRCLGLWAPRERVWRDGERFVDPFRPGLRYPARSLREFDLLTAQHLDCVRRAFVEATVFVFTLGLTEAWVSRQDGAVFPACPGTVAGGFDPMQHGFVNLGVGEVAEDLREFVREVRKLNPALRVVLTVSPVPLVATATGGHVLTANTYSKSVLRVAAEEASRADRDIAYFPAYEIVTGPQAPHEFYAADRRQVSAEAVAAVMEALLAPAPAAAPPPPADCEAAAQTISRSIVGQECEEVMSDRAAWAT